jgi:dienelactone hydrolase
MMLRQLRVLVAAVLAVLVVATAAPTGASQPSRPSRPFTPVLVEPTGRYEIGRTTLHLVDGDRADPWRPNRDRELMTTVTYPAHRVDGHPRGRWFSAPVAADLEAAGAQPPFDLAPGSLDLAGARANAHVGAPVARPSGRSNDGWPVVVFSPGFNTPREQNTAQIEDLASQGYVVVSVDHTFEAPVEFPGGRVVAPAPEISSDDPAVFAAVLRRAIDARVADTRFVLDELVELDRGRNPDAGHRRLPVGLRRRLDLAHVGMFGFSYGGYTAAETMFFDRRIDAGINLDGTMEHGQGVIETSPSLPGLSVQPGLDRPFLLFGQEGHDHLTLEPESSDLSWPDFWSNQRGPKLDISLRQAGHNSFSDLQTLVAQVDEAFDLPAEAAERVEDLIGTIDPDRSIAAQRAYIAAFFDLHVRHRDTHLLDGPSPAHPEVQFIP